jgi:hypothetical protein
MRFRSLAVSFCIAVSTSAPPALAQGDANSRALAVQLFDEAEALFASGQTAQACPKYAESYRLDPQLGVLIYLAECFEKEGRLASAWGSFREAAEVAQKRGDQRGALASARARALEPRLSYVLIQVPEASRRPGLELLRDGAVIAPVLWGARAAIDTGTHRLEARAPGHTAWQVELVIAKEGSTETVMVPALVAETGKQGAAAAAGRPASTTSPGTSQRIAAIAVGGLGLAAVGVGGFFGLSAQSSYSDSKDLCNDDDYCTGRGTQLRESAKSKALAATIATGVGVAALATAGVLWFTAAQGDKAPADSARAGARRRAFNVAPASNAWGLEVSGAF